MSDNTTVHREAFRLLADREIGRGIARIVYCSAILPDCVVKVEENAGSFQNVAEWQVWEAVKGTEFAKWFAPCLHISSCGAVLIQARTKPALAFPDKLPVFLTDTKRANYGMLGKSFVCHDYGTHVMHTFGMSKRVRKVDWWDL